MTLRKLLKSKKKKKTTDYGVDWDSALNVDSQRFMEEKKKKKKLVDSGVIWNNTKVKVHNDLRDVED